MGSVNGTQVYNYTEVRGMLYYALRLYNDAKGTEKHLNELSITQKQALLRSVNVDEIEGKHNGELVIWSLVGTIERQRLFLDKNPLYIFNTKLGVR